MDRAERRNRTENQIRKRLKLIKAVFREEAGSWRNFTVSHRNHKKKPLDCGQPGCCTCHGDNRFKPPRAPAPREEDE